MSNHIVFIINSLDSKSGSERVACLLANLFVEKLKYTVTILNRSTDKEGVAYFLNDSVKVLALNGNSFVFLKKVQNFINEQKPKNILVHNMGKLSLLMSFLQKKDSKLISLEHGAFLARPCYVRFLTHLCYKKIDHVVVLNEFDKIEFSKKIKNVHKIYNPNPFKSLKSLSYDKKRKSVIALGRLHPEKNFEHLIMAWVGLGIKTDGWELKIFGKGPEYKNLNQLIKVENQSNIKLMGEVENAQLAYNEAALYVMSSKNEGLPMVLIEAQSNGIPIVSYNCPHGPREIITHNIDGFLVENQNIKELSDAIYTMLSSFKLREIFAKESLKSAERFSNEVILMQWESTL